MHLIKHNLWQLLISYMFWYWGAILRESFRSNDYNPNKLLCVRIALTEMIKT